MFSLGLAAALLFILLLGLTVLRVLDNRPSPNAEVLCELATFFEKNIPDHKAQTLPSNAKHA